MRFAMPPSRSADLSARILVLGIVVEEGGPLTLANVGLRLSEDFGGTQYSKNAVHQNLKNLAKGSYLRLVKEGVEPSFNVYEALEKGVIEFEQWLTASEPDPPALRDAMLARLNFYTRRAKRDDIEGLVARVRQQQKRCARQFALAHSNVTHEEDQQQQQRGSVTLSDSLRLIQLEDEAELWGNLSTRFRKLQKRLEGLFVSSGGRVSDG
jgi:DNA-binding PadR family transcriptional regulator